jgi:hypothetical protein
MAAPANGIVVVPAAAQASSAQPETNGIDLQAKAKERVRSKQAKLQKADWVDNAQKRKDLEPGQKKALEWLNAHLLDNSREILDLRAAVESGVIGSAKKQKAQKQECEFFDPDKYKVFKQLPRYFLSQMLAKFAGFVSEELDCVDFADRMGIRLLCSYFFGVSCRSTIPRGLAGDKVNLVLFFQVRSEHDLFKDRISKWRTENFVDEDFKVDWSKGVFRLTWNDAELCEDRIIAEIKHSNGQSTDVASFNLTEANSFGGNHSDDQAFFKKGKHELGCSQFFCDEQLEQVMKILDKEGLAADALKALALKQITDKVSKGLNNATSASVFTLAKAQADDARKQALSKRARIPSKGLAAPMTMANGA